MKKMFNIANLEVRSIRVTEVYDEKCRSYREKHTIKVTNSDKKSKYFTYTTEVIGYIDRKNLLKNAMYCLFMDYQTCTYCRSEEEFVEEFGYDEKTGRKIYKQLVSEFDRLNELFDENTYDVLEKTYENY